MIVPFNPNDAPPGMIAVPRATCEGCAFLSRNSDCNRPTVPCNRSGRADRTPVIFRPVSEKEQSVPDAPKPSTAPNRDHAADLLDEAKRIVTGVRRASYGKPEDNFGCIADLWNIYLAKCGFDFTDTDQGLRPHNIAALMVLMKIARLAESPAHHDSVVDIAGYAACYAAGVATATATVEVS